MFAHVEQTAEVIAEDVEQIAEVIVEDVEQTVEVIAEDAEVIFVVEDEIFVEVSSGKNI